MDHFLRKILTKRHEVHQLHKRSNLVHQKCLAFFDLDNHDQNNIVYHRRSWFEHGPTGIAPQYNLLVSVPEKCGTQFWFNLLHHFNFPSYSSENVDDNEFSARAEDAKSFQRTSVIPTCYNMRQEILERGITVAVVRHPFLRLHSGNFYTYGKGQT